MLSSAGQPNPEAYTKGENDFENLCRRGDLDLVCHLLAPNGRACQITTDLDSFWAGSYQQVRKDLRGRYPKHHWPEDPSRDSGL